MTELLASIPPLQKLVAALTAIIVLILVWAVVRVINSCDNTLEVWHLIATRGPDGKQYADWNKIGQGAGVVLCVVLPLMYGNSPKMDAIGLAAVMGVALLYLGGVSSYAANLRAKQGTVVTEKVTEPAAPTPAKETTTRTETPPVGRT